MHIISGRFKGKMIKTPAGIRPTEDRVRKAIFDILGDISGLSFLELFAGSGAVGMEALSLGVKEAVFVEKDRYAFKKIQENLNILGLKPPKGLNSEAPFEILNKDAIEILPLLAKNNRKFDIIFLDPPYYQGIAEKTLQSLELCDILTHSGIVIIQHFKKDFVPQEQLKLKLFKQAKYGDTQLSFYQKDTI